SLGVYFSPVNMNAPESFRKSARVAIPLGVPCSSWSALLWKELSTEFPSVCVPGALY
ncbi:hypothetical protein K443DRAFT_103490, partial [Laccaria amethystina LaAM-08-1]